MVKIITLLSLISLATLSMIACESDKTAVIDADILITEETTTTSLYENSEVSSECDQATVYKRYCNYEGLCLMEEYYTSEGELMGYTLFEYNEEGKVILSEIFSATDELIFCEKREYDNAGVKISVYTADGNIVAEEYISVEVGI